VPAAPYSNGLIAKAKANPPPELETDFHLDEHLTPEQVTRSHGRNFNGKAVVRDLQHASPGSDVQDSPIGQAHRNPARTCQDFSAYTGRDEESTFEAGSR
jgi:hypothetical protein